MTIPYKIAALVYVFDEAGRLLLLHRKKPPNRELYSPIGGKLEQDIGESPYACALREIEEEVGLTLALEDIRLMGIVSERGYSSEGGNAEEKEQGMHWLMFCFEVVRPVEVTVREFDEGRLEWIDPIAVPGLDIPKTDREVIWPLVLEHSMMLHPAKRRHEAGVFSVHIDCRNAEEFVVTREWPRK